jgi:protein-L-isoaspartate(D-aspartate) O-methyltransferase
LFFNTYSEIRRAYVRQVPAATQLADARLEAAFAAVSGEDSLGPGVADFALDTGLVPTRDSEPVYLYPDDLVGIIRSKRTTMASPDCMRS